MPFSSYTRTSFIHSFILKQWNDRRNSAKRNIKIKDKVIEESDVDGNMLVCTFSNYYETMSIKDKVNEFFKNWII